MARMTFAVAAVVMGVAVAGCGAGDSATDTVTSQATASSASATNIRSAAPTTSALAARPAYTLGAYFQDNGITKTTVKRDTPGAPQIDIPLPPGWKDIDANAPQDAWGAMEFAEPSDPNIPPVVIVGVVKLDGPAEPARILEFGSNSVRNMPDYQGPDNGQASRLSGFDAVDIAGTAVRDGRTIYVARRTVVIPGQDGLYVMALEAQGLQTDQAVLADAMRVIDAETRIQP